VQIEVEGQLVGLDLLAGDLLQRGQGHLVMGRAEMLEDLPLTVALLRDLHRGGPGTGLHPPDVHTSQPRTTPG